MRKYPVVILVYLTLVAGVAYGATIYVDDDNTTGPWHGTPEHPYQFIQDGIDAASNGDTVLVKDGLYSLSKGPRNVNLDFYGRAITVTSENGAESTVIDCEGSGRGFFFHFGESRRSVLRGFTITNGSPAFGLGGGICCVNSSSPIIEQNIIIGNSGHEGGGIYCSDASPTIQDNIITENMVGRSGGGISCSYSSEVTMQNNTITNNSADHFGGGICYSYSSEATIQGNEISGNSAGFSGGGIYCYYSDAAIQNNEITGNSAGHHGGGVYYCGFYLTTVRNNEISENSAGENGGGIYCRYFCPLIIANNTVSRNSAGGVGGGISSWDESSPTVLNTILWANGSDEIFVDALSKIHITYSDIEGGWPGEGNIDEDPLFVDPVNGDYHLTDDSPCIGKGTMRPGVARTDIEGNPRPNPPHSKPDMGAYESPSGEPVSPCSLTVLSPEAVEVDELRQFRDELLTKNGTGQELIHLYYQHSPEVADILLEHPMLAIRSAAILEDVMPGIRFLLGDKRGRDIRMAPLLVARIEELFEAIGKEGSEESRRTLSTLSDQLEEYEGMRFSQIWQAMDKRQPERFALLQNHPNPFNPDTWIPYKLSEDASVVIRIHNATGGLIRTLDLGHKPAGFYVGRDEAAHWDGKSETGEQVASGIYFYVIQAQDFIATRKMVIAK